MGSFTRNSSFVTRPFVVDFITKKTYIEPLSRTKRVFDFFAYTITSWTFFVLIIGFGGTMLLTWLLPQHHEGIVSIAGWYIAYMTLLVIIQALLYKAFPQSKAMVKLQMLVESPYHKLFFYKKVDSIFINHATKVTFTNLHYFTFDFDFFGECKDFRKNIRYEKVPFKQGNYNLVIEFTKPVTGKITGTIYGHFDQLVIQ